MVEYSNRESRQKFIAEKFGDYLKGSVLNIGGGGDKVLLNYCQPNEYIELDMCGEPDLLIDLDIRYLMNFLLIIHPVSKEGYW